METLDGLMFIFNNRKVNCDCFYNSNIWNFKMIANDVEAIYKSFYNVAILTTFSIRETEREDHIRRHAGTIDTSN